jgi:uncharacterized membrane protein YadS
MEKKSFWKSKTFWVNAISLVAIGLQTQFGFVIDAEYQAMALAGINWVLRLITKQAVTLT